MSRTGIFSFGGFALVAGLAGIAYLVLWATHRRQISGRVSLPLAGALLATMVGVQLIHIWLGINARPPAYLFGPSNWRASVFSLHPFRMMLYVFAAVLGHFLICATGSLLAERRARMLMPATRLAYALALITIGATIGMAVRLWGPAYFPATPPASSPTASRETTERYLTDWLATEPDSPHARRLLDAHQEVYGPPALPDPAPRPLSP
jgi:hypothetical protein